MPTITEHCEVTKEQIEKRQANLNEKVPPSLDGLIKSGGSVRWVTHAFAGGKIKTFPAMYDADGKPLRSLEKRKSPGSLYVGLPLIKVTMARLTPKGQGHFVDLQKQTGRFKTTIGFTKTDDDMFDEEKYGRYKVCVETLNKLYNVDLPTHLAKGKNTDGVYVTSCVPEIKLKWEEFKKKAQKRASKKAGKKVDIDEDALREEFCDDLIAKVTDSDNKFMREKNISIVNAEVTVLDFDLRSNQKLERKISDRDRKILDDLRQYFKDDAEECEYLDLIEKQIKDSHSTGNPLKLNDELIINDSEGTPMTMLDAIKLVDWRGALVSPTLKFRAVDYKQIESVQMMTPIDLASIQVEVNGRRDVVQSSGSSVGFFGSPKRASTEPEETASAPKRIKSEPVLLETE